MADAERYFKDLIDGKRSAPAERALFAVLKVASLAYAQLLKLRAFAYDVGALRSFRAGCPVISVGNLTLGGTGKTPTVVWLAGYLMARGKKVAVISRGYGGSAEGRVAIVSDGREIFLSPEESGDEPYLMALKVPGLMVVIGADRHQAARLALEKLNPDLFLLDDGFQHLRLKRDLDLLLLDAQAPFGNGFTLPAGMLRESRSAAERADLVIYTRTPEGARPDLLPHKPSVSARHALSGLKPLSGGDRIEFKELKGKRVLAFSGIADPEGFFGSLEREGVELTTTLSFADHTPYGEEELAAIMRLKVASRSTILLTTEKDAVKLAGHASALGGCYVAEMELAFADARPLEEALEKLL